MADDLENVVYELCRHCDHFVDEEPGTGNGFVHLENGEQEFDHEPQASGQRHTLRDWRRLRPDLFERRADGRVGPNSMHHSRRGKLDAGGGTGPGT